MKAPKLKSTSGRGAERIVAELNARTEVLSLRDDLPL